MIGSEIIYSLQSTGWLPKSDVNVKRKSGCPCGYLSGGGYLHIRAWIT